MKTVRISFTMTQDQFDSLYGPTATDAIDNHTDESKPIHQAITNRLTEAMCGAEVKPTLYDVFIRTN